MRRSALASREHADVDPALRAAVYDSLSELSDAQGDPREAVSLAASAVSAAEGLGTPEPLARAYFVTARALNATGQTALAIYFGKGAIAQIERQRQYFSGEDERLDRGFLLDKIGMYRTVADWLMGSGRIDEGLDVLQLLKAQELYDFTSRAAATAMRVGASLLSTTSSAPGTATTRRCCAPMRPRARRSIACAACRIGPESPRRSACGSMRC